MQDLDVRTGSGPADAAAGHTPLVLIAEDEPDNQAILRTVVESIIEARAVVAADGLQVLRTVEREKPDIVLLDLMMPLLDGFQVAARMRANPAMADIPIVAVSALARPGDREAAIEAGCDDFVRKPFDLDDLERVIIRYLRVTSDE